MMFRWGKQRLGWSHDLVALGEDPYLERWILWLGLLGTLRLHRFYRGDADPVRA